MDTRPLDGILVVSLEQAVAAPLCSSRLADAGARVLKIERPGGDFARGYDQAVHGEASYFVWINRGKESVELDIKRVEDRTLLERIIARADVFIQNLAPGAAARAGFESSALRANNPRLITCDISGYGEEGEYSQMKAYDLLVQAETGLVAVSGPAGEYGRVGISISDIAAGLNAVIGIQQALLARAQSGRGTGIKVSLFDSTADLMTVPFLHARFGGRAPKRVGLKHPSIAPYGGFETADGETLVISIQNEREWAQFCKEVLRRPELTLDTRFASNNLRVANRPQLDDMIHGIFGSRSRAEMEDILRGAGIAYGAVNSVDQLARHPQLRLWPVTTPSGPAELIAPPMQTEFDSGQFGSVPALGENTETVRREFD